MKRLRLIVLVLLSVLLPIRGAVAAAMLCAPGGAPAAPMVVAAQGHHGHHGFSAGDDAVHAEHAMAHPAAHHHAGGDSSPDGHSATCHLCASGCCMASISGSVPALAPPGLRSALAFPTLTAPVPAFHSDGQDRPPRTT